MYWDKCEYAFFSANERSKGEGKGKEEEGSLSPFPFSFPSSSFPFLFLSLSFSLRPFVCAKKTHLRIYPINYSFSPCAMHNGDRNRVPRAKRVSQLWALDDAYVVKWRQSG